MVVRIPVAQLRVGMFIHKMGGAWLKHPFLRGSFLLNSAEDLRVIVEAGIADVWIDRSRGLNLGKSAGDEADVEQPPLEPQEVVALLEPVASLAPPALRRASNPATLQSEIDRARKLCIAAKGEVMVMFQEVRLGKAVDPKTTLPLVGEIADAVQRNAAAILSVARLKSHDDYTYMHSVAVCALMLALANQMGLDEDQTRLAGVGGLMHDLGKARMPLEVLNKPGRLTEAEFAVMRAHTEAGARVLQAGGAPPEVQDIALHHHERVDGRGYPHALSGDGISLLARMGAVCDVYDAVTSTRAYKRPWDPATSIREMAHWEGHFDKQVFSAFVKSVGIYPIGSLVRLSSQKLAVVVQPGIDSLLTPTVRAFFSVRSKEPVPLQTIDLGSPACRESIVGLEDPETWGFKHLDDLWR